MHYFENPECSTDTQSVVENFMYSKDHFRTCIICNGYTIARANSSSFNAKELTNPRNMINFFCGYHYDYLINGEKLEKENKLNDKNDSFKRKYYQVRKYHDAIWSYMQSIPKSKFKMHHKTLDKFHFDPDWAFTQGSLTPLD